MTAVLIFWCLSRLLVKVSGLPSLRAILGLLFCAAFAAAQPAGIEGVVLNHVTGLPLAGVHLRLVTVDFGGGGLEQAYGAISDRAGHFSITNLKPGIYLVFPERTGFVQFQSAHPNMPVGLVPLKPGQQLADYKVEMTPRAVMTGRVVDEYGDPVQNVSVQLEPVSPDTQMGPSFGLQSNVATDDLGEFHLVTAPGRYRLHATRFPFQRESGPEIRTDGTSAAPYADTYYPNAPVPAPHRSWQSVLGRMSLGWRSGWFAARPRKRTLSPSQASSPEPRTALFRRSCCTMGKAPSRSTIRARRWPPSTANSPSAV